MPLVSMPQVWVNPAVIAANWMSSRATAFGVKNEDETPNEPLPSWPYWLSPQQNATLPNDAVVMAQVCTPPAATAL